MAYTSVFENILFIEGGHPEAKFIARAESDLSFKIGAQLKNLNDVKRDLALKIRISGGNALLNFTYGQKHRILAIDDVAFWGKGDIAVLPDAVYRELITAHSNK